MDGDFELADRAGIETPMFANDFESGFIKQGPRRTNGEFRGDRTSVGSNDELHTYGSFLAEGKSSRRIGWRPLEAFTSAKNDLLHWRRRRRGRDWFLGGRGIGRLFGFDNPRRARDRQLKSNGWIWRRDGSQSRCRWQRQ